MQTKTNRRGLAIGAAIALVGTFFGAAPASYATTDGQYIEIRPLSNEDTSNFGGLLTEDFPIYAQLKSGTTNANANFTNSRLIWQITRTSGEVNVFALANSSSVTAAGNYSGSVSDSTVVSSTSAELATVFGAGSQVNVASWTGSTAVTVAARVTNAGVNDNGQGSIAPLYLRALNSASGTIAFTSSSPNVTFTVMAFIDDFGGQNGKYDVGEWFATKTITLYASGRLSPSVSIGAPARGDTTVTASATLTTVNWSNLNGNAFLQVESDVANVPDFNAGTGATSSSTVSVALSALSVSRRAGVVSSSFDLQHSQSMSEGAKFFGSLRYVSTSGTASSVDGGVLLGVSVSATATAPGVTELSVTSSNGVNIVASGASQLTVRPNQTHTLTVLASSGSGAASVASTVTISLSGTALGAGTKMVSVNGAAFSATYGTFTVTTATNGVGTFTIATTGFIGGDQITVSARVGNIASTPVNLLTADPVFTATADSTHYVTSPSTNVTLGFSVRDQWNQLSSRTDHFLRVTRGGTGFSYATTISHEAIASGRASVVFSSATTGSATVTVQSHRLLEGAYVALGTATTQVTITVTSSPMAFSTGLAPSRAASVSYFANTVSWVTVTGSASAAGAGISVTGADLVFRLSADVPATSSGTFSLNAGAAGAYSFQVAALRSGSKTMTLTTGTATTTSLVVVADAASDMGRTIAWDTTTIQSGKTRVVTGTLTDQNGNPVDTTAIGRTAGDSGTASLVITYTGTAGIVVGTVPTETDVEGKFRISVLTSATDQGTLTLTAVYMPQGASTLARNQITSVQAIAVAPAAPAEVNAVIGSFNGRWAVRVENAKGSVVSVKAGNRWVKFSALNDNYLFSRKSVVGRTIAVSVWVDGELQNSQTITIK